MDRVWILWTSPACDGRGTEGAVRVEVCGSDRWARLGAPHHGYKLACYSYDVDDQGDLTDERWEWDTDSRGMPPGAGSWMHKLGPTQVLFLYGCLTHKGWYRGCGWGVHPRAVHDERVAERLAERGLLNVEERRKGTRKFWLYTVANPKLGWLIVQSGGVVPEDAVSQGEVTR